MTAFPTKAHFLQKDSDVEITVEQHVESKREALLVASDLCIIDDC